MGVLLLAVGCDGIETTVSYPDDTGGMIPAETGSDSTPTETAPADTGHTGGNTSPTDPGLITTSNSLYDIFDSSALESLSGAAATGNSTGDSYKTAVAQYLTALSSGVVTTGNTNSYGNYNITIFGDTSTYDFGNGYTSEVGYMAVAAGEVSDQVAAAPDATTLIDNEYDISGKLALSVPYMLVGVNILRDAEGKIVSSASTITYYGADYYANNLHTMEYAGSGQVVSVINNYEQTDVKFTDPAELQGAEAGAEQLFNGIDYVAGAPREYSIRGTEIN